MTDIIEECARAVMEQDGCGLSVEGVRVLCNDPRLGSLRDPYGKPHLEAVCDCEQKAMAVLRVPSLRAGLLYDKLEAIRAAEERRK